MSWPWPRLVIGQMVFTIQWQPQRLTQEDQDQDQPKIKEIILNTTQKKFLAAEEMETETESALPTLASSEASGEVAETVTEAVDMSGPTLATEPRKRGKGLKKAAEEDSKKKDIAAMKVAPEKRGRKAAAVAAPNKEEEEAEKKPGAKRGKKAMASVEEKREEEVPELAVPEPEVSSSTR